MSLESAREFVNKIRFMNDLMQSLRDAAENERELIIGKAGYDFTYDELKQALEEYNDNLVDAVVGGSARVCGVAVEHDMCPCRGPVVSR